MHSIREDEAGSQRFEKVSAENDRADDFVSFEYRGKQWRVFRIYKHGRRLPFYYLKCKIGGRMLFQSTGEAKKVKAIEVAKLKIGAALDGRWDALRETRLRDTKPVSTLGAILRAYEGEKKDGRIVGGILGSVEAIGMRADTPRRNANALRVIVRRVLDREEVESCSGSVLARPDLVSEFIRKHVADAGEDKVKRDSRVRGARSTVIQARSVFTKAALSHCYGGLALPELDAFLKAPLPTAKLPPKEGLTSDDVYEMAQAATWLRDSQNEQARALYLVHLLFRHLALRNDEVEQARVEWLMPRKGEVFLRSGEKREIAGVLAVITRSYWEPKQSEGLVPISPCVWKELQQFVKGREPLDFIVPAATKTDRAELVDRVHGDFVRPWTAKLRKKGYELRRWGQTLVKRREGDEMASRFVRHAEKSTAGKFYDTEVVLPAPITLSDCGL